MALYGNDSDLGDEELKEVNGGYLFSPDGSCQTEVIDDRTGEVLASFFTRGEAIEYAYAHGQAVRYLNDDQLEALRQRAKER